MNRAVVYKVVSAALVLCVAAQGLMGIRLAEASRRNDDLGLHQCSRTDAVPFLSLQNSPKTRGGCSVSDRFSPAPPIVCGLWKASQKHAFKSRIHTPVLDEVNEPETLYALRCQFTI
jgi:hypothetical protein